MPGTHKCGTTRHGGRFYDRGARTTPADSSSTWLPLPLPRSCLRYGSLRKGGVRWHKELEDYKGEPCATECAAPPHASQRPETIELIDSDDECSANGPSLARTSHDLLERTPGAKCVCFKALKHCLSTSAVLCKAQHSWQAPRLVTLLLWQAPRESRTATPVLFARSPCRRQQSALPVAAAEHRHDRGAGCEWRCCRGGGGLG